MKKAIISLLISQMQLCAVTIHLHNDTNYTIEATIQDARGDIMEKMTLIPNAWADWSDTFGEQGYSGPFPPPPEQNVYSSTPYRVTWNCQSGDIYSVVSNVAPGNIVTPNQGEGLRSCKKVSSGSASSGAPPS